MNDLITTETIITEKACTKCGEQKPLSEFSKAKKGKGSRRANCKLCDIKRNEEWRLNHKEYYKKRRAGIREQENERCKKYRAEHGDRIREARRISDASKRITVKGQLNNRLKSALYQSLKKGSKSFRHWESLVGYTVDQLKKHLEKRFILGMSWEHFLAGELHIDHKIPIAAFNFSKPEDLDFKRCWALKNLQPMWAKENIRKGAKINKPFQPSLAITEGATL